ncbi:MAG: YegS/Rv2252/BmrU family lipid kinase [Alcanivoracaceae bacterium]|jgi:YegS/Rv2252/BmrU family lipid kinase|nr:YegS/Rv2252/BmrU family lipid kinase [Alcanivoracaceae bacterium]
MKALVIYNPAAGGGQEQKLQRFLAALEQRHVAVTLYRTRAPNDATDYLQSLQDQGDVVVAVGGDGTTNEVINGLKPGTPLALLATGTANVLAKELGLPSHPERAAAVIAAGRDLEIWPARVGERRFVMMAGLGYDAWVVHGVDLALKARVGKLAYVLSMIRQISGYGSKRYRLLVDGRPHDCFSAIITNGRYYGGSFLLSRRADITRPRMQVLMFQSPGIASLLRFLLALLFGRMENMAGVQSVEATRVVLASPHGEPVQTDGDPAGVLPLTLAVDAEPVPVRVPSRTLRQLGKL